jgi:hypothetical protein
MLYGAPVWIEALKKECNKTIYNRVQRLINIKIAKAFRTTSNEGLCTLTGLTPIVIEVEEAAKLYNTMRNNQAHEIDHEVTRKTGFTQQIRFESQVNKTSTLYKYSQTAARASMGRSRNSNIYSEQTRTPVKVHTLQQIFQ